MKFIDDGIKKTVIFEDTDTWSEKRLVEQGIAFIKNLIQRMRELKPLEGNK